MRVATGEIGGQVAVYKYLTESNYQISLRRRSVSGYATTHFSESSDDVMSGAQIAKQWPGKDYTGQVMYKVEIPTEKMSGFSIPRPDGGDGVAGWEYRANSYPEYGRGQWNQFRINPVKLDDVVIKRLL